MTITGALALAFVVFASLTAHAQDVQGFVEARIAMQPGVSGPMWQTVQRFRPTASAEITERLKLVSTIEGGFSQGRNPEREMQRLAEESGLMPFFLAQGFEVQEHRNSILRIDGSSDYLDVDRLHADYYGGSFDLRVGRQALNWGSGQFFNPTDPFPEVLLAEPWRPRRGVNAIRLAVPFGELNDVVAVVASNDSFTALRAAARVRMNWLGTDFALIGAFRGDANNGLVGVDIRGTLGVGYWLEAAYFLGENPHEQITFGIDYSFAVLERATAFLQYHRNGSGSTSVAATDMLLNAGGGASPLASAERDPFAPFTRGRDYILLGTTVGIIAELSLTAAALQNLNDGSGVAFPTISYAAVDWLEIALTAQFAYALWGRGGELRPHRDDLQMELAIGPEGDVISIDFAGLVPTATVILWTRASF